jgi:hypothetical protein
LKSTSLDQSPGDHNNTVNIKRALAQLNMSSVTPNQITDTDYSYPIHINSSNPKHRRNFDNKFNELKLQTAIDFSQLRSITNTSQNKGAVPGYPSTTLDFTMKSTKQKGNRYGAGTTVGIHSSMNGSNQK